MVKRINRASKSLSVVLHLNGGQVCQTVFTKYCDAVLEAWLKKISSRGLNMY